MTACMIYITAGTPEEARKLAEMLVEERLAACVNILDGATSVYRWNGAIEADSETILIAKTTQSKRVPAMKRVKEVHSYDTPCIVSYDVADGDKDYLDWIGSEVEQR